MTYGDFLLYFWIGFCVFTAPYIIPFMIKQVINIIKVNKRA